MVNDQAIRDRSNIIFICKPMNVLLTTSKTRHTITNPIVSPKPHEAARIGLWG